MNTVPALAPEQIDEIESPSHITKMVLMSLAHVDDIVEIDDQANVEHQLIEDDVFLAEVSVE